MERQGRGPRLPGLGGQGSPAGIRTDSEGRYCLNDLHKASGGEERNATWRFLRLDTTNELIAELKSTTSGGLNPVAAKRGRNGGTFVVKELVYAYAMWISASFNLKVIRAYDQLQTQGVAVADHAAADLLKNPFAYLEVLLEQAKALKVKNDELEAEVNQVWVARWSFRVSARPEGNPFFGSTGRTAGLSCVRVNAGGSSDLAVSIADANQRGFTLCRIALPLLP